MESNRDQDIIREEDRVLDTVRPVRVLLPLVIGLGAVFLLLRSRFNWEHWNEIHWSTHLCVWLGIAVLFLAIRHLAYAFRLYTLSNGAFTYWKSIELIFIWEFSSAVSPTSLGGSAVALVVLAQEKLKTARVGAIVIYTVVLDTAFFIIGLPILFILVGPKMIQPGVSILSDIGGLGTTFIVAYFIMTCYGLFFFYGLFYNPIQFKYIIFAVSKIGLLKKWKQRITDFGNEIVVSSREIKKEPLSFHLKAILGTIVAWTCRFLVLSAVIIAFTPNISMTLGHQFDLFARLESMFVIIAFSPTPGGSGFVELVASNLISDFAVKNSLIIAFVWRLIAYYSYLIAGAIIVPIWIKNVLARRRMKNAHKS